MTDDRTPLRRRTVLKTIGGTSVALGVGTGVAAAERNGKGKKAVQASRSPSQPETGRDEPAYWVKFAPH